MTVQTWETWDNASASSFWLIPQRLPTLLVQPLCTFMPQSGQWSQQWNGPSKGKDSERKYINKNENKKNNNKTNKETQHTRLTFTFKALLVQTPQ